MKKTLIILIFIVYPISCFAQIDENLAKNAEVILRVESSEGIECDKYCWTTVIIIKELKNKNNHSFGKTLKVAFNSGDDGIPLGESTIYLEKYNPARNDNWKLVGGMSKKGVSHDKLTDQALIKYWRQEKIPFEKLDKHYCSTNIFSSEKECAVIVKNKRWTEFKDKYQSGYEVWFYSSPPHTWESMLGKQGYALFRNGKLIADILTEEN